MTQQPSKLFCGSLIVAALVATILVAAAFVHQPQAALATDHSAAPTISSVAINSGAGDDDTYTVAGSLFRIAVTFSEHITVTGTPQLTLNLGDGTRAAAYDSGSGTTVLYFTYTFAIGDVDDDGISIDANSLSLTGGSIRDAAGNDADLAHQALAANPKHKVGLSDTTAPTVSSIDITSDAGSGDTYITGDRIDLAAIFSENVNIVGRPQLTLNLGDGTRVAKYSGTFGAKATFTYTVVSGDVDTDGISIDANGLNSNGATIQDQIGNTADLAHGAVAADSEHKVDAVKPTVSSVAITSAAGSDNAYVAGDKISVTATFSESVTVSGSPKLELQIGSTTKTVSSASVSDSTIVFDYTVVTGDLDTDGISIDANSLSLDDNDGSIKDGAGNNANLAHSAVAADSAHKVLAADTTAPTVSSIAITSDAGDDDTYVAGDKIDFVVTFSESVKVTGDPQLTLSLGDGTRIAAHIPSSGATVKFTYTVVVGDVDDDGVSIAANSLSFNGAVIKDEAGNNANLAHSAVATDSAHKVLAPGGV